MKYLLFLIPVSLYGQCAVLGSSSGCSNTGPAPTLQTFVSNQTTQLQLFTTSNTPVTITANLPEASSSFRASEIQTCYTNSTCIFSTAASNSLSIGLNKVFDNGIRYSGATVVILNIDPLYGTAVSGYSGGCIAGNPGMMTWQLAQDLALMTHIQSAGFRIWISFSPLTSSMTACGLTPGSVTNTQYSNAVNPMHTAYLSYMTSHGITVIDKTITIHEPQGENLISTGNASPFTAAQWTTMAEAGCAVDLVYVASCGAGFAAGDNSYSSYYISNATGVNEWFFETYGTYNNYYSNINTMMANCSAALSASMGCDNSEGNSPVWGSGTSESTAFAGCTWDSGTVGYVSYNEYYAWLNIVSHAVNGYGATSFTWFGTFPMNLLLSSQTSNCFSSSSANSAYKVMTTSVGSTAVVSIFKTATTFSGSNTIINGAKITGAIIQ